nr:uncharacterized protein LOC116821425 [Chelonoidis abingdonii]
MHGGGCSLPPEERDADLPIPERLASQGHLPVPSTGPGGTSPVHMRRSWPSGKRDQVYVSSGSMHRIHWGATGLVRDHSLSLPLDRFETLKGLIASVTAFPMMTARVCLQIVRHVVVCTYMVRHAMLRMRALQLWLASQYSQARDGLDKVVMILSQVAFLVAITSACRVSELRVLTSEPPYTVFHKDKVQLRPHPAFLPKVVSAFHMDQDICPKPHSSNEERHPHTLDVLRALTFYLNHTRLFRKSSQLFIALAEHMRGQPISA